MTDGGVEETGFIFRKPFDPHHDASIRTRERAAIPNLFYSRLSINESSID